MRKGSTTVILIVAIAVVILLFMILVPRLNPKEEPGSEIKFKNDIVTIGNYFVSDLAPYSSSDGQKIKTNIQFEVYNNGDQEISYLEIDFFDLSGFKPDELKCGYGQPVNSTKCVFSKDNNNALESLDARDISITFITPDKIDVPTPFSISFAIRYVYSGIRDVHIPIIDGITKKEPISKFRQSEPSTGPVVLDIEPLLERETMVDGKVVKQYWGIVGTPFTTKFKFKHVGSVQGKIKDVTIAVGNVKLSNPELQGLEKGSPCDFGGTGSNQFSLNLPTKDKSYTFNSIGNTFTNSSTKEVKVPFDTLICVFSASDQQQAEYTAIISAAFAYEYEFIRSQEFVVQPSLTQSQET